MVKDVGFGLASESVCLVLDEDQGGVLDFWDTKYAGRIGLNSARRSVWQLVAVVSGEAQDVGAGDGHSEAHFSYCHLALPLPHQELKISAL